MKLGDGTAESHGRAQDALDALWRYTGEMFLPNAADDLLVGARLVPDVRAGESSWQARVTEVLERATLTVPAAVYMQRGGRNGRHTEHLGHLLAEMQILQRSFPNAQW